MAASKISGLPVVTSVTPATDSTVVVASGVTSEITIANLADGAPWTTSYQARVDRGHPLAVGGTRVGVPGVNFSTSNTLAVVADTIYYAPFIVFDTITVDACLCEVTSGAGTVARLGILNANDAWQPNGVEQDAGTIDPSTNGVKTASFTGNNLTAGRYLTALVCDGAATFRFAVGGIGLGENNPSLGSNTFHIRHVLASVGTGALSAANDWDTATAGQTAHQHMVFLRLTGV